MDESRSNSPIEHHPMHIDRDDGHPCQRSEGLDIPSIDHALLELVLPNFQSIFKYLNCYNSGSNKKLLDTVAMNLFKALMIYATNMHSPAMSHLGIRVKYASTSTDKDSDARIKLFRYIALTSLLPSIHEFVKYKASSYEISNPNESGDSDDSATIRHQRASLRQAKILRCMLKITSLVVPPLRLYVYVSYILQRKETKTPSIAMNHNQFAYECAHKNQNRRNRKVNFLYAYRRIWYQEFILTLGLLPIEAWKKLPQKVKMYYRRASNQIKFILPEILCRKDEYSNSVGSYDASRCHECAICGMKPIAIPYKTSCGHFYCYTCLRLSVSDDARFKCVVCGQIIARSEPAF